MRIRHNANSPKRVELIMPPGDELDVSEEVAAQLQAADMHFQPVEELKPKAQAKAAPKKTAGRRP